VIVIAVCLLCLTFLLFTRNYDYCIHRSAKGVDYDGELNDVMVNLNDTIDSISADMLPAIAKILHFYKCYAAACQKGFLQDMAQNQQISSTSVASLPSTEENQVEERLFLVMEIRYEHKWTDEQWRQCVHENWAEILKDPKNIFCSAATLGKFMVANCDVSKKIIEIQDPTKKVEVQLLRNWLSEEAMKAFHDNIVLFK
jgi:hypothetical protein